MRKYDRDTLEQSRVDGVLLEEAVDVRPVAGELAGEPGDSPLLPVELIAYQSADRIHWIQVCDNRAASPGPEEKRSKTRDGCYN